jgi:hypothetical protein
LFVVIRGVFEAVERRRRLVVEAPDRLRGQRPLHIDERTHQLELSFQLLLEMLQEVSRVGAAHRAVFQVARSGGQVERNRDGGGGPERGARPLLAQILEQDVPPQAESQSRQGTARKPLAEGVDNEPQVAGLTGVIESGQPVQLVSAPAEVEPDGHQPPP